MSSIEFEPWPKIARLNREIVISEKIDGTNAAILIVEIPGEELDLSPNSPQAENPPLHVEFDGITNMAYLVYAQSRTRFITPGNDNFGFARWVQDNAQALVEILGPGRHFGEWWGSGIQRGYGLAKGEKRFSLFNAGRWADEADLAGVPGLGVVPTLYKGIFDEAAIETAATKLEVYGSVASPGFKPAEGIVIWHDAARISFKVTLVGDDKPKGQQ